MEEKVKILIVEDEVLIAESLKEIMESLGYEVIGIAIRAKQALEIIEQQMPDIAMLDISLKGQEDGIWLAEQIRAKYNFPYIFLTSFGNKSTVERAAKTQPYGYLMKPFEKVDIYTAIEVAITNFAIQQNRAEGGEELEKDESGVVIRDSIFIKDEYLFVKVRFDQITFVRSDGNYLEIHTKGKRHIVKNTLKKFATKLPEDQFMQIHRSYLINLGMIESFGANYLYIDGKEIPISATYKEELTKKLMTF
jgi:DNA-binding LytR/AlgR family response regulator